MERAEGGERGAEGRIFALKVICGNHEDPVRRHICREIEILHKANNPYVVQCHSMFDHAREIQILLEYMERDARSLMLESFLADVARQILHGIAYLHSRKIVYRDIKPSNLLINDRNEVKITDFGVSQILAQTMDPCNSSVGMIDDRLFKPGADQHRFEQRHLRRLHRRHLEPRGIDSQVLHGEVSIHGGEAGRLGQPSVGNLLRTAGRLGLQMDPAKGGWGLSSSSIRSLSPAVGERERSEEEGIFGKVGVLSILCGCV